MTTTIQGRKETKKIKRFQKFMQRVNKLRFADSSPAQKLNTYQQFSKFRNKSGCQDISSYAISTTGNSTFSIIEESINYSNYA